MARRRWTPGLVIALIGTAILARAGQRIYDDQADAHQLIRTAISHARSARKNIVLIFGANWCADCYALEAQMHTRKLARLLKDDFVVVNVDVGLFNKNLDVAAHYGVPIKRGIPAIAILDSRGKLLFAQDQGQFAKARALNYQTFFQFFRKWRPKR